KLEDIKKIYNMGNSLITALDIKEFEIAKGDYISVTGPSGSGKTTFLNIIGLMDRPTEGRVFIEGKDALSLNNEEMSKFRRQTVGYVFQSFNLLPHLTAVENVMLPLIPYKTSFNLKDKAGKILTEVGLKGRGKHLPSQLSGGE
ncbi:MAG TPA: hypothetical protein DD426_12675, partial [Clostridiaceae bacterium]|nr:hypothetical protein [Clostridiaceae bacterium]